MAPGWNLQPAYTLSHDHEPSLPLPDLPTSSFKRPCRRDTVGSPIALLYRHAPSTSISHSPLAPLARFVPIVRFLAIQPIAVHGSELEAAVVTHDDCVWPRRLVWHLLPYGIHVRAIKIPCAVPAPAPD
jgi:hypothetical protein